MTPRATLIEAMQDASDPADALDRMLAAMEGLGLKVVPVEATDGMKIATYAAYEQCAIHSYGASPDCDYLYSIMVAVAPNLLGEDA